VEARVEQMEKILKERDMEVLFARVASNLLNKGNAEEAIRVCESGIKRYPMYAQGHFVLANCYDSKGMQNEARNEYERVIKYDPNHLAALKKLADLYHVAGLDDLYEEKIKILATLDPLDESIIKTAQSLGVYQENGTIEKPGSEAIDSTEEKTPDTADPLEVDKLDLSQFDNQDDDFTTIVQGKPEEEEEKEEQEEEIVLGVGAAAAELNVDTEVNHRLAYEEELRIRDDSSDSKSDSGDEYEDLDELQFDKNEEEDKHPEESQENWAMTVGDNDATEIVMTKNANEQESKLKKPTNEKSEKKDHSKKPDSEDYQQPKIVTQTLGEILVSQKKYVEAQKVFETLQEQHPENKNFIKKVAFLKKIIALEQK